MTEVLFSLEVKDLRDFYKWCETVVGQVRFKPDRWAIQRELEDHYEDHVKDLERLGYPHELARQRALGAMGDPVEVGRALDKVHKPWLGWLWEISRVVLALSLAAALFFGRDGANWTQRIWNTVFPPEDLAGFEQDMTVYDVLLNQQEGRDYIFYRGQLTAEPLWTNGYTISIVKGSWYQWDTDSGYFKGYLLLRVAPDRFWYEQPTAILSGLRMSDSSGRYVENCSIHAPGMNGTQEENQFVAAYAYNHRPVPGEDGSYRPFDSADLGGWYVRMEITMRETAPEWVDVTYLYGGNDWVWRIQWEAVE